MDKHFITFSVGAGSYSANLVFQLHDRPLLIEVVDLYPGDYKPKLPYLFIANKERKIVMWPVESKNDADFGEAIASKIYEKSKELEINLYP